MSRNNLLGPSVPVKAKCSRLKRVADYGSKRRQLLMIVVSLLLTVLPACASATNVDFTGLAVGVKLDDQLPGIPGIRFLKYSAVVGGVVADTPSGHVARFNDAPGCEFCVSGARIAFVNLQRSLTVHVGLLPVPGAVVQRDVRLTAFAADGAQRATAVTNVTAGAGFDATLTVTTAAPQIASIVIEAMNDTAALALIAVRDVTFDETPSAGVPDFFLDGPQGATVVLGSGMVDVPLSITRLGGSSGNIIFTMGPLPNGVSGALLPNPVSGNSATLRLQANTSSLPTTQLVVVTGSPMSVGVGPAPRNHSIIVTTTPEVRVTGPADIDLDGCAPNGAHGTLVRNYWVMRAPNVSGPLTVALSGLPADVTGTVDPQTLQFPGAALGQQVQLSLTTVAGLVLPDTPVILHLTGSGIDTSYSVIVHGSCPRQNRNFTMRGQFTYLNNGDPHPAFVQGAQVEIFRHRSDWFDDKVGETTTDPEGRYSKDLFASAPGDYYARLRLISSQTEYRDADNSSVWSFDTPHQSNSAPVIDTGTTQFSRDGGQGTPRVAVWQGFHNAAIEYQITTGQPVPGGFLKVLDFRGHVVPLTYYDEVHWAHGSLINPLILPLPSGGMILNYQETSHEFGHVIRHVLDGSYFHWNDDSSLYVYGRSHNFCTTQGGTVANEGFGFNEGWAEYWGRQVNCCPNDINNQNMEGTVASDLNRLAMCSGVGRSGMVQVLARGPQIIHSDMDFRREYHLQFLHCQVGNIFDACLPGGPGPSPAHPVMVTPHPRNRLLAAISARERALDALKEQQASSTGLMPVILSATVQEGSLVIQRMKDELAAVDLANPTASYMERALSERLRRAEFTARRKAIQIRALEHGLSAASPDQRLPIQRRIRLLNESRIEDASLDSLHPLPETTDDDDISR